MGSGILMCNGASPPWNYCNIFAPENGWLVHTKLVSFLGRLGLLLRGPNVRFRGEWESTFLFRFVGQPSKPTKPSTWRRLLMWMISLILAAGSRAQESIHKKPSRFAKQFFFGVAPKITKISVWDISFVISHVRFPRYIFSMVFFRVYILNWKRSHFVVSFLLWRISGDHPEDGYGVGRGPWNNQLNMENIPFSIGFS